ncbi:sigma 54 modulation/S30EA ribosomal C-terminal domain-containing protein [Kribbella sp. NPDC050124]|uniref:sigma 54 modulation/S30EA ribosomal C-terminal domain-containing protein n=1 Tax=Kribbella sp. NPDC050124 TaxID=3364114 RepID=UPI0037B18620
MSGNRAPVDAELQVHTDGILPTDVVEQIRVNLRAVLGPWAAAAVARVGRLRHPGSVRPVIAQLNLASPAGPVRAQIAARTTADAAVLLAARVHSQLRLIPNLRAHGHFRPVTPCRTWWPELLRPPGDRELVRVKLCLPEECTVDTAIRRLEAGDHEFHLFHEPVSDEDSVLQRVGPGSYRLLQLRPGKAIGSTSTATPVTVVHTRPLVLPLPRALTGRPFLFFADPSTRRGRLLYLRYDGDYALLSPALPATDW